MAAIPS